MLVRSFIRINIRFSNYGGSYEAGVRFGRTTKNLPVVSHCGVKLSPRYTIAQLFDKIYYDVQIEFQSLLRNTWGKNLLVRPGWMDNKATSLLGERLGGGPSISKLSTASNVMPKGCQWNIELPRKWRGKYMSPERVVEVEQSSSSRIIFAYIGGVFFACNETARLEKRRGDRRRH